MASSTDNLLMQAAQDGDVQPMANLARTQVEHGLAWTWRPPRIARVLARDDTLGVVAVRDGTAVGFCLASYDETSMHILLLAVVPPARRSGVGRRLVDWHLVCGRVAGCRVVTLEVRASKRGAREFYVSLGFEVVGRESGYYQGAEDALRMEKQIVI